MDEYYDKIVKYFQLKQEYDRRYNNKKKSIINNDTLSLKQKRTQIRKISMPCISCKKNSYKGTIFTYQNNIYSAKCGNTTSPCTLDISLKRPEFVNIDNDKEIFESSLKNVESKIINIKLELLFNFITETEMIADFTELKKQYTDDNEMLITLRQTLAEQTNVVERTTTVKTDTIELYTALETYKNNYSEYLATNNKDLLKDCIELYIDDILPILENIRENENMAEFIEVEMIGNNKKNMIHLVKLIKIKNTIQSQEIVLSEPEIISFVL